VGDDPFLHGGGLGVLAFLLLELMDADEGMSARDLADRLGYKVPTVRSKLRAMGLLGLCERDGDGMWRSLAFDSRTVALEVGTLGKGAARRERREAESLDRADAVEEWRATQANTNPPLAPPLLLELLAPGPPI